MANYRDPKVTDTTTGSNSAGKWIAVAIAVVLALLLIAWLMGAFNNNTPETVPVVTTEEVPATTTTPVPATP